MPKLTSTVVRELAVEARAELGCITNASRYGQTIKTEKDWADVMRHAENARLAAGEIWTHAHLELQKVQRG